MSKSANSSVELSQHGANVSSVSPQFWGLTKSDLQTPHRFDRVI
jgi:hypothetical protein